MRTRIALAILGTAVAALALAGAATFIVVRVTARGEAEDRVRDQTDALASALAVRDGERPIGFRSDRLTRLAQGLEVDDLTIVVIDGQNRMRGTLPRAVAEADVRRAAADRQSASGRRDGRVWAISPVEGPFRPEDAPPNPVIDGSVALVVGSDPATPPTTPVLGLFAWVALVTVVAGAAVALLLARSLTRPLRRAEAATGRIATGDLSARAPEPTAGTPTEIADLSRSINTMAAALERSRGVERQFLLSVSHDLRTPLTSIRGWAEAIGDGAAPDAGHAAAIIGTEAKRLDRLVGDLLELGRLEARQFSLVAVEIEVGPLVASVAAGAEPDARRSGVAVEVLDRSIGARALVDPDRLGQVVANLLENALKFATHRVSLVVDADDEGVSITVSDDGPGVAAEDLPHIFERLYVSRHQPTRRESGSGLGLAIVRELIAAMGGTVEARSPAGPAGGTALRVALSRRAAAPPPDAGESPSLRS